MERKTILITGCSVGQGRDLAENLTKAGYRVAATARKPEDLNGLSVALKLKLDVTDNDSIKTAVSKTIEEFGGIDILINNAGFAIRSTIEEAPEELLQRMFDVNVFGSIRMVRAVAPKPLNVLAMGPGLSVAELAGLGVRRISVGGALARVAWAAMLAAAERIKAGSFDGLAGGTPGRLMNDRFGGFA